MTKSFELNILVADGQPSTLRIYSKALSALGCGVETASDPVSLSAQLKSASFDVLIYDLALDGAEVEGTLEALGSDYPDMKIIAVCDGSSISSAVAAIKAGCVDYLAKPVSMLTLERSLLKVTKPEMTAVAKRKPCTAKPIVVTRNGLLGDSPAMQRVRILISQFARSVAPVLITGESGTGKEVCAAELHRQSDRVERAFVAINCAALPKDLMESELFGHVKGAFTGAASDRAGAAYSAHGGTLFLDEIGEMDISLQAKLLRFLQTGELKRVGSDKTQTVDVRVICATNRDLSLEIARGNFREDLYYRLNVLSLDMPALRDRGNDVVMLARHFYREFVELEGGEGGGLSNSAVMALVEHSWPGNVRELQNVIRRAVVMTGGKALTASDITGLDSVTSNVHPLKTKGPMLVHSQEASSRRLIDVQRPFADIEREIVQCVIEMNGGSLPRAAAALAISPSTLYRKREAWGASAAAV